MTKRHIWLTLVFVDVDTAKVMARTHGLSKGLLLLLIRRAGFLVRVLFSGAYGRRSQRGRIILGLLGVDTLRNVYGIV